LIFTGKINVFAGFLKSISEEFFGRPLLGLILSYGKRLKSMPFLAYVLKLHVSRLNATY